MIKVHGKPILQWQVETARQAGIEDIVIVRGFLKDSIDIQGVVYAENARYAETNMVETLFCAAEYFRSRLIVSYGDILYEKQVIQKLANSKHQISVAVDTNWKDYWEERFTNPLMDAETLKLDSNGNIIEIGQKPENLNCIQGQYIGLTAFQGEGLEEVQKVYKKEKEYFLRGEKSICKERNLDELYMTDLIQGVINQGNMVSPVFITGNWLEVDSLKDFKLAEQYVDSKSISLKIFR
jgi:choline kinase